MKRSTPLFLVMACFLPLGCLAQQNAAAMAAGRERALFNSALPENDLAVVAYRVEERINMNFGSSVTTYEVSSLSLVSTTDLGQNNSRIITPKYAKQKAMTPASAIALPEPSQTMVKPIAVVVGIEPVAAPPAKKYVNIDIISTYERVLEKGYNSADMLKKVGNSRFFDGDLLAAAKWYERLFSLTADLEPVMYYRYAQALKSISQIAKANEMMLIFEKKSKQEN